MSTHTLHRALQDNKLLLTLYFLSVGLYLYLFKQAGIGLHFALILGLFALGLLVRRYRVLVLITLMVTSLMVLAALYTAKMMSGAKLFLLIPDLAAIAMDANPIEIKTAVRSFGSPNEWLAVLSLLLGFLCYWRSRRIRSSRTTARTVLAVSLLALATLAVTHKFIYWRAYDGLSAARQVYAQNADRIHAKDRFIWGATAGYAGKDTVVLVLGEETRGDHLGINGYDRDTTPNLSRIDDLITYTQAISNAPSTLASTPVILTRSRGETESRIFGEKSLIAAFNEAGYATYYVSYLRKVHYGDNAINQIVRDAEHYQNDSPTTGQLDDLAGAQRVADIVASPGDRKLIVFKLIGSHFDYKDRYDESFNKFRPSYLRLPYHGAQLAEKQTLVNTYDNSLLVTDKAVASIVATLERTSGRTSLAFISDHGTALFEDGKTAVRGFSAANYSIPMFFWLKDGYFDAAKRTSLVENRQTPVDSTCFLDTFLSLQDIRTPLKKGCDLTAGIITPYPRIVVRGDRMVDYDRVIMASGKTARSAFTPPIAVRSFPHKPSDPRVEP